MILPSGLKQSARDARIMSPLASINIPASRQEKTPPLCTKARSGAPLQPPMPNPTGKRAYYIANDDPQPQPEVALGLFTWNEEPTISVTKSISEPAR